MARIRRASDIRPKRETGAGWQKTLTRIIAGTAQGCNTATVRVHTLKPGGRIPRRELPVKRIFYLLKGTLLFMDGDGAIQVLGEGDSAITDAGERHHFQNTSSSDARVLVIEII